MVLIVFYFNRRYKTNEKKASLNFKITLFKNLTFNLYLFQMLIISKRSKPIKEFSSKKRLSN